MLLRILLSLYSTTQVKEKRYFCKEKNVDFNFDPDSVLAAGSGNIEQEREREKYIYF